MAAMSLLFFSAIFGLVVKGVVLDTLAKPVPGAAVFVPGGPGTYTLEDGSFTLDVPQDARRIRVEAVGYAPVETDVQQPMEIRMVPKAVLAREIVVSASGRAELLSQTPLSVNIMEGAEAIRIRAFPRLEEALKTLPGVYPVGSDYITQVPSVRGMARGRSVLLLDGMRIVDDRSVGPRFFVPPGLIRRTEVLSGPSSLLYGSGAIGGVITASTRQSSGFWAGYNTVNSSWQTGLLWAGFGARVGLWGGRASDYSYPDSFAVNSGFKTAGALAGFEKNGFSVQYIYAHPRDIGRPSTKATKTSTYLKDYHDMLRLGYHGVIGPFNAKLWVWGHQKHKDAQVIKDHPDDSTLSTKLTRYNNTDAGFSGLFTTFVSSHTLGFGVSGFFRRNLDIFLDRNEVSYSGDTLSIGSEQPTDRAYYTETGLFFFDEFPAGPLRMRAGLRGDYMSWGEARNDPGATAAITGEMAGLWVGPAGISVIASARRGFRAPELRELYYTGETPRGYQIANPDLQPEKGLSGEAGIRWSNSLFWSEAEVFYTHLNDMLTQVEIRDDTTGFTNQDRCFLKGLELEAGALIRGWGVKLTGFAMQGFNLEDGSFLRDIAAPSWSGRLWRETGIVQPWITLRGRAAKRDPGSGELERDAFWLLDAGFDLQVFRDFKLCFGVNNGFNTLFYDNADKKSLPGPGRNLFLGLQGSF